MQFQLSNPKVFVDAVSVISELVKEVKLRFDSEGMRIIALDPANVAMVSLFIPSAVFSQFQASGEIIGVSLDSLKSILRRAGSASALSMKSEDNTLMIEIADKIRRTFTLALIDIDTEDKALPKLEFSANVAMPCTDFIDSIEDCSIVADSCSFALADSKFIIEAKGLNSARSEFSTDEASIKGEPAKSRYSIEYLQKMLKASKLSENIQVSFGNSYPLKLEFINPQANVIFILAPRVETEE
ncbi:MAG: DNA polymerase sliding clamp [Nanoarchaeota archaeon]